MKNTIGTLAYYDSFAGLIPCKVISIQDKIPAGHDLRGQTSLCTIRARVTANRRAYNKGDEIESTALHIIPRNHVSFKKYKSVIVGGYSWDA